MPEVDLADPGLDPAVQQEFQKREQARAQAMRLQQQQTGKEVENPDAHIVSMIESIGQLDLNEGGEWDFYGISSGAVFLKRMKDHFQGKMGNDPFFRSARPETSAFSSPKVGTSGNWESPSPLNAFKLPPQERARELCYFALSCATCLLRTIHQPTFYEQLQNLYDTPQESWGVDGVRFLGLLYAVMALGCMYNTYEDPSKPPVSYQSAAEEGYISPFPCPATSLLLAHRSPDLQHQILWRRPPGAGRRCRVSRRYVPPSAGLYDSVPSVHVQH
jgi:hypothetical protein